MFLHNLEYMANSLRTYSLTEVSILNAVLSMGASCNYMVPVLGVARFHYQMFNCLLTNMCYLKARSNVKVVLSSHVHVSQSYLRTRVIFVCSSLSGRGVLWEMGGCTGFLY